MPASATVLKALALAGLISGLALPAAAQMPQPLPAEVLVDTPDAAKAAFLRENVVVRGPVTGGLTFDLPDSFYASRLILLGESHGVAAPQVLDLELLTHLNQRIGVRDYVAEVDPVQGDRLNAYLETGDEAILDRVFDFWSDGGAQWGNASFEAKVRGVRALNQTLPVERRIRFLGVDAIQDWPLLRQWIEDRGGRIEAAAWDAADAKGRAALALAALDASSDAGDPVLARLKDLLTRLKTNTHRETAIFETYAHAVRSGELGERPAYGLWGVYHVMQGPVNATQPFAARVVASDLPTAGAVTSMVVLSLDSAVQIPAPTPQGVRRMRLDSFNIDGPFVKVQGSATLRAASEAGQFLVFNPAAPGSPIEPGDFMRIQTSVGQSFVLDPTWPSSRYSQYIGVFRGSDWAPPRD